MGLTKLKVITKVSDDTNVQTYYNTTFVQMILGTLTRRFTSPRRLLTGSVPVERTFWKPFVSHEASVSFNSTSIS